VPTLFALFALFALRILPTLRRASFLAYRRLTFARLLAGFVRRRLLAAFIMPLRHFAFLVVAMRRMLRLFTLCAGRFRRFVHCIAP
jgi:hypothetical protein